MITVQMHQIKNLMVLFHLSLDDSYFHQSMLDYVHTIVIEEDDQFLQNVFEFLVHNTLVNTHQNFQATFIILLHLIMDRLIVENKKEYALEMLVHMVSGEMIFFKLLHIKCYQAAKQVLMCMQFLSTEDWVWHLAIHLAFYQKTSFDEYVISGLSQNLNTAELMQLTDLMIFSQRHFVLAEDFMSDWLFSLCPPSNKKIQQVFLNPSVTSEARKNFLSVFLLLLDFKCVAHYHLKALCYCNEHCPPLLDQLILCNGCSPGVFQELLNFYEQLLINGHFSIFEFKKFIFSHPRKGFSPLHEILYRGKEDHLKIYLHFIDAQYRQARFTLEDIQAAFLKINTSGYNAIFQAINNQNYAVTLTFFHYYLDYFRTSDVYQHLHFGHYNPVLKKNIKLQCGEDKPHHQDIYLMLKDLLSKIKALLPSTMVFPRNWEGVFDRGLQKIVDENRGCSSPKGIR